MLPLFSLFIMTPHGGHHFSWYYGSCELLAVLQLVVQHNHYWDADDALSKDVSDNGYKTLDIQEGNISKGKTSSLQKGPLNPHAQRSQPHHHIPYASPLVLAKETLCSNPSNSNGEEK
jgi:hypothetical protein